MFQMSSVSLTNGNYIHILMPDCCFIRLLVGYSFLVAGIILAGAAERQEGGSSSHCDAEQRLDASRRQQERDQSTKRKYGRGEQQGGVFLSTAE